MRTLIATLVALCCSTAFAHEPTPIYIWPQPPDVPTQCEWRQVRVNTYLQRTYRQGAHVWQTKTLIGTRLEWERVCPVPCPQPIHSLNSDLDRWGSDTGWAQYR